MCNVNTRVAAADYRLFCIAVVQRYIPPNNNEEDILSLFFDNKGSQLLTHAMLRKLSPEVRDKARAEMLKLHDKILEMYRGIPPKLMLIFRCLLTLHPPLPPKISIILKIQFSL